jgi:phospholipid/cholesterol/gamma-HCH transport system substrate-binding protein
MLTRLVRTQLILFTIASVIGITAMIFVYLQVPTLLGIGRLTVTLQLPHTGGLYRFGNVTYRGVQVGRVTRVEPTADGATAELSLDTSPRIPADVRANVRSASAVGEQYVDLIPRSDGPPFLQDGSVIASQDASVPQPVGPVLDQLSAMVKSIPKDKLSGLLDESFHAFNGAGYDIGSLLDSGSRITADANAAAENTRMLFEDAAPLLDSQAKSTDALRTWAHGLQQVTGQVVTNDRDLRTILATGPDTANEVSRLLNQIKPTLPVLLANLTSVAQVGVTYNASLEQLLVLLPPYVGGFGSLSQMQNSEGLSFGAFALTNNDPPACTVGFLPPSQWRSPDDETVIDTPDDLYCKLPQDSPIAVRGVRNNPCMGKPGKRAPTVEICNSDEQYMPLAMRQHALGPYPMDPNLISQGVPPDSRVLPDEKTFGPVQGTPLPPDAPEPAPAPPPDASAPPPTNAPAAFSGSAAAAHPRAATANYDPGTGRYVGADGRVYQQSDLVTSKATSTSEPTWTALLPH